METRQYIDLDTPLMNFGDSQSCFTIRDAVSGLSITGNTGSGKSTGSAANFALKYLKAGMGGLVLTVKPSDRRDWVKYCIHTGREKDLIIVEPGGRHRFNALKYISQEKDGERAITDNIVEVLNTVIRAEEDRQVRSDDSFWENALTTLMSMMVDLCLIAFGKVTIDDLYNIVQSLPRPNETLNDAIEPNSQSAFRQAYKLAKLSIDKKVATWKQKRTAEGNNQFANQSAYEEALYDAVPDARQFNYITEYFWNSFRFLSPKTRSLVEYIFSGFLYSFLREPVYSLFSKGESTFKPEDCFEGKIILLCLPIKKYHRVGRLCQTQFKYIWQRAVEKRVVDDYSLPVFLWSDEAQNTVHEHDSDFLATARSSRVATVFISQNLPNYYAAMGGEKGKYRVASMLANLSCKIFHSCTCIETNKWASDLVGEDYMPDPSMNISISQNNFTSGQNLSLKLQKVFRPEKFTTLKVGGASSNYNVEAIIYKQGDPIHRNKNYSIINFKQFF
ncbi:type IV secretory system conjugative DNA transfer family protein [Mucilaginibacter pedocola]|uniref:TraD/TraG TraM recognition site domain-containing protein n=1 Tax=Mucilaginibacter pedocola TaxID=1792845 RepID=A0A1S9P9Y6_9SPHI|nr:TraM recognition domain-containing protein [Mucilaginibacter pedocola]OOQ57398.1 hypothetical protein BC343_14965 [Mucilaginibacter pedocola]